MYIIQQPLQILMHIARGGTTHDPFSFPRHPKDFIVLFPEIRLENNFCWVLSGGWRSSAVRCEFKKLSYD
jgi:hypothetical protein